ncbi:MAG TPA: GNAT family N-acetyltransferase [Pyrinomonadaceae bacterium]|nr:GNAT family N-acetyltransferase [Pyrinomonadaceae bacterium]
MVAALQAPPAPDPTGRHSHYDEIETERLRLRLFRPEDLDALHELTSDREVMRFIGDGVVLPREDIEANLTSIIGSFRRRGYGRWAVEEKATGRLTGYCGFGLSDEKVGPELVYLLGREFWGRGFIYEAARACLRYGFEELRLGAVKAVSMPDNLRSRRVMERLGMRFARAGVYHGYPCVIYEIDRAQWAPEGAAYVLGKGRIAV